MVALGPLPNNQNPGSCLQTLFGHDEDSIYTVQRVTRRRSEITKLEAKNVDGNRCRIIVKGPTVYGFGHHPRKKTVGFLEEFDGCSQHLDIKELSCIYSIP